MKKLIIQLILPFCLVLLHCNNVWAQACPNGDFENWTVRPYSQPDSMWFTSNPKSLAKADSLTVWQVTGFSEQAVHIQTAIIGPDTLQAYITNTLRDPLSGQGGVPYTQQPTIITGYYRYNMVSGDSAILFVLFKKSGVVISTNIYKISNSTGSVSAFAAFSLPLATLTMAPDSVIVAAASSNVFGTGIHSGSWLELDQLEFAGTGITQPIPGGSFNSWLPDTLFTPLEWKVGSGGQEGSNVSRSSMHYSGSYSVQMISQPSGGGGGGPVSPAQLSTGTFPPNMGPVGGLPYSRMSDTLTGYYMFVPAGIDTGHLNLSLYAGGTPVGGNGFNFMAASSWTYFSLPFSAGYMPDTMRIDITSSSFGATLPGSILYVDHLQLNSWPLDINKNINAANVAVAYPNPVNDILNIVLNNNIEYPISVKIYDMTGRVIDSRSYAVSTCVISIPIGYLPGGLYFYEVTNNSNTVRNKFLKD